MPSATITVRFNKMLYDKVKGHWMCTSDLVRNAVRMYLEHLEEEEKKAENPLISPVLQEKNFINTPVKQDVLQDIPVEDTVEYQNYETTNYQDETDTDSQSDDETLMLIKKLRREMDELDSELNQLKSKYVN